MDHLPLKVRVFDQIIVDHPDRANPSCCQILERRSTQSPCSNDQNRCVAQRFLSGAADLSQNDMAGIAVQFRIGKTGGGLFGRRV